MKRAHGLTLIDTIIMVVILLAFLAIVLPILAQIQYPDRARHNNRQVRAVQNAMVLFIGHPQFILSRHKLAR